MSPLPQTPQSKLQWKGSRRPCRITLEMRFMGAAHARAVHAVTRQRVENDDDVVMERKTFAQVLRFKDAQSRLAHDEQRPVGEDQLNSAVRTINHVPTDIRHRDRSERAGGGTGNRCHRIHLPRV